MTTFRKLKKLDPKSAVRPDEMKPMKPSYKELDPGSAVRENEMPVRGKRPTRRKV